MRISSLQMVVLGMLTLGSEAGADPAKNTATVGVKSVNQVTQGLRDRIAATRTLPPSLRKMVKGMPDAARAATNGVVYSEVSAEASRAQVDLKRSANGGRTTYFGTKQAISLDTPAKGVRVMWTPYDPVEQISHPRNNTSTISIDKTFANGKSMHRRITPVSGSPGSWLVKTTRYFGPGDSMRKQSYIIKGKQATRLETKTSAD